MAVVDGVNSNSNNFQRNNGFFHSQCQIFGIFEILYKLKRNPVIKIKLDSKSQTVEIACLEKYSYILIFRYNYIYKFL